MSETATPAAPAAAPSAPATSGAPPTTATPSRPSSFSDPNLNWSADAPASPAGTPSDPAQPASATTGAEPTATPAPGPIPFDRHKSILDGAYKERDQFKTELAALKSQIDSPDGQRLRQWAESYARNPEVWFEQTVRDLAQNNPNLVPSLRSQAARLLASRQEQAPSFEPDIPVFNEQGQQVAQTFSAQKVQQLIAHAVAEALQKEVSPLKQDFQTRQQRDAEQRERASALQTANKQFEAAKQWPGFLSDPAKGTVDPDVVKAFNEHPEWDLRDAYIHVVVPKLGAKKEAEVLEHLQTKAAAAQSVNPSSAPVASHGRIASFNDPRLKW